VLSRAPYFAVCVLVTKYDAHGFLLSSFSLVFKAVLLLSGEWGRAGISVKPRPLLRCLHFSHPIQRPWFSPFLSVIGLQILFAALLRRENNVAGLGKSSKFSQRNIKKPVETNQSKSV
jgi:hypothetical protein